MEAFQKRIILEYKELDGRLRKLENIYDSQFDKLTMLERRILMEQQVGMRVYLRTLGDRLHYIEGIDLKSI